MTLDNETRKAQLRKVIDALVDLIRAADDALESGALSERRWEVIDRPAEDIYAEVAEALYKRPYAGLQQWKDVIAHATRDD